ncbi:O-antigen translocase [Flavobacterium sp.]|uniref:O-antigen translocase n=1 Tax=Flavobacterium sp. TaxID=239 RepID=UPI0037C0C0A2
MISKLKNNPLIKVLSLNSVSVGVSFVLGLLSSKIISVFLGPSGMALMGSFRNFTAMIKSIATLGMNTSVVKLIVENKEDKEEVSLIYSTFFGVFLGLAIVLGVSVALCSSWISNLIFFTNSYTTPIQFFGLLLPLIVVNVFWTSIYNAFEKFKHIISIQIISNLIIFATTAYLVWQNNIQGGLLSVAVGEVIMFFVTYLFIRKTFSEFKFDYHQIEFKKYLSDMQRFSIMALLSAVLVPLTLILIRDNIVSVHSIQEAGIWDGVNRLSSFYMLIFNTGISMYYMPKLASLKTDSEFKMELKSYFKTLVPLFLVMILAIFFLKSYIVQLAFTEEFNKINSILVWQLLGDFFRIMTLAFGFQILVKSMLKRYFIIEIVFNSCFLILAYLWIPIRSSEGVVQAYLVTNILSFIIILFMFRKTLNN